MYNVKSFTSIIDEFRNLYLGFNFTTDVIVGFPGETEEEFLETCKITREIGFTHIHTFRYSDRTGTRASRMPDHIPSKIMAERSEVIRQISEENKLRYQYIINGQRQRVLVEKMDIEGFAYGHSQNYVYLKFHAPDATRNSFVDVVITEDMIV
jgi:threonylcarbamoyladenosine tRNA methylthiotransferase MtaB